MKTVPLRDFVWEPCAGRGDMAKTISDAGYRVIASDVWAYDKSVFPVLTGIDALEAALPAGVRTIVTNPPYGDMPRKLVRHWLGLLEPVGGMLCLLMNSLWRESQSGQLLTSLHPAYAGKVRMRRRIRWLAGTPLDKGGAPQIDHAWMVWDPVEIPRNCRSTCHPAIRGSRTAAQPAVPLSNTCAPARRRAWRVVGRR